jgi:DNA mismatch repair protein MutS2
MRVMSEPSADSPARRLQRQAESVLEWEKVLALVAGLARSTLGAERCRTLALESDIESARQRLQETGEMVALLTADDPFPPLPIPDLRDALGRALKGATLDPLELRDISTAIGLGLNVLRYLGRPRQDLPAIARLAEPLAELHSCERVKTAIDRAVDAEGQIRESATPDLRRFMHQAQDLKQNMRRRLDLIVASTRYEDVLQERYVAQREGRYVILIKADMRGKIPGIVHDVSASGATVFFEPRELVELNNAIKVAELDVTREVTRILHELSTRVAEHGDMLRQSLALLATLDCISAKAAFSARVRGSAVTLNDRGRLMLREARHPLLMLAKEQVVPNDLLVEESVRVLVVSGPNTGGKTVALKIMGLFALMARAGLQPCCREGSEMAFFPEIYADIGDAQDLARDLSSFSAHMMQMIALLATTDAHAAARPGSGTRCRTLVLLDEPVTSTDPAEGAALAEALLIRLSELDMKVVATTHYNSLKALAQTTVGFQNASVEFDVATLSPTYRLFLGIPGGSSAIEIAGRLGMDERLLAHARTLLNREDAKVESMLEDLQQKQRRLTEDLATASAARAQAEQAAKESAEIAERLRSGEHEQRKGTKRKLADDLMRARAQVQAIMDELKADRTVVKAKTAKQKLVELEARVSAALSTPVETVPIDSMAAGGLVEIAGLGAEGVLLEAPQGKKRVRVRVGEKEMSVSTGSLVGLAGQDAALKQTPPLSTGSIARTRSSVPVGDTLVALDLRGRTADEALDMTVAALDRAALGDTALIRIIHGHGTGRLKTVVRDYLRGSPYVRSFRPGDRAEGGDGVTIVEMG